MAKIDDRVRILTDLNGPYKNMTGRVIDTYSGGVVVCLDSNFRREVDELGFVFRSVHIQDKNCQVISKSCMDVE